MSNKPGTLWVVATPIGNLDDMAPRAVRVLREADAIAAEDTRHTGRLLKHFGIETRMMSLHEHNESRRIPRLVERLAGGETVALVSDAGTPLVSDPGYRLVRSAREAGIGVFAVPGPCAAIAALSIAGLPTDRFRFDGFPPARPGPRQKHFARLASVPETLIFYEAPQRILACLEDMRAAFGGERGAVLCRELTKLYDTSLSGTLQSLLEALRADPGQVRGEMTLVVEGAGEVDAAVKLAEGRRLFDLLATELPAGKAAKLAAAWTGCRRRDIYQ